jgi:Core-2/I-Branching enzyme
MGFSPVSVALTLLREALLQDDFSYFSLLSGSDHPIQSNEFILDFLS